MTTTSPDVEDFWDDLLAYVEEKQVVPVIGSELLTIEIEGTTVPLYQAVAERLLAKYGVAVPEGGLRPNQELDEAVALLANTNRRRFEDLYRPIHDILEKLLERQSEPPRALLQLAEIAQFDLFATTTPDDLLARALNTVRFGGGAGTDEIPYAPNLPNERRRDLPKTTTSSYSAVFYLFGRADVNPFFAIHEEDALEFPYALQQGKGPERVVQQLRSRHLLFIGCNFAEWLSRFFIRMSRSERLFSKREREFLVGKATENEQPFTVFLQRFSGNTRCLALNAADFVDELHRRWRERNPPAPRVADPVAAPNTGGTTGPMAGSIFISYARDDLAAARALSAAMQEIGGDVWLDMEDIKEGDEWDPHTRGAIQRCGVFLAVVSRTTEQRTEGYFRLEWRLAVERARRIQGRKFIFPLVIDDDYNGNPSGYTLVPEEFRTLQFAHAPNGRLSEGLRTELTQTIRELRRGRAS